MSAIKGESVEERDEHKKKCDRIFFTKEKWNEMNFKNAILKVFEDEREGGGGR